MKPVEIGYNVWVGPKQSCAAAGGEFDRVIHIHRSDLRQICPALAKATRNDFFLDYKDGESLAALGDEFDEVWGFCREPGKLLVHCQAGQTRGPTLAVLALAARGTSPFQALGHVFEAVWNQRRIPCNFVPAPIKDIVERWEAHR